MDRCAFASLVRQVADLSQQQCGQLLARLKETTGKARTIDILQTAAAPTLHCPRCQGIYAYRHGEANGLQRFRCRACGKTFNVLTGTPLARLRHKSKWLDYLDCMLASNSVRRSAQCVEVAKNTSMRWRHRFLCLTKHDRPALLQGIVEADETFLRESQKGARKLDRPARKRAGKAAKPGSASEQVCILVARDRSGATRDAVTGCGPVTKAQLLQHLAPTLAPDTLLVTDANVAYRAFARATGTAHAWVNVSTGVRFKQHLRSAVHVQNVNGYHSRLHGWLRCFNGVATRYLPNYLGWSWAIDQARIRSPETLLRAAIGVFHS